MSTLTKLTSQERAVTEYLKELKVSLIPQHVAEMVHPSEDWKHDKWLVLVHVNSKMVTFDYSTGTGHRIDKVVKQGHSFHHFPLNMIKNGKANAEMQGYPNAGIHCKKLVQSIGRTHLQASGQFAPMPSQCSILYCLVGEYHSAQENFLDFCDNFGYNNDSIKTLDLYNTMCQNARDLGKIFTGQQIEHLNELLQDY